MKPNQMKRTKCERRLECKKQEGTKGRKEAGVRRETDGRRDAVLSPLRDHKWDHRGGATMDVNKFHMFWLQKPKQVSS